jgi:5-methylcytosine-specific restriction endonuclease McrA
MQIVNCLVCNKEFSAREADTKRNLGKFCSQKCCGEHKKIQTALKKTIPNTTCSWCYSGFYKTQSKKKAKSGNYFCSKVCQNTAQRIDGLKEIHPDHYGDGSSSYRRIAFRSLKHECDICKYSEYVGVLVVHHKNKDRSNNAVENLQILCPTCHDVFHFCDASGRFNRKIN